MDSSYRALCPGDRTLATIMRFFPKLALLLPPSGMGLQAASLKVAQVTSLLRVDLLLIRMNVVLAKGQVLGSQEGVEKQTDSDSPV